MIMGSQCLLTASQMSDEAAKEAEIFEPDASDDFSKKTLGLQWQWNANPKEDWYKLTSEGLCLKAVKQEEKSNMVIIQIFFFRSGQHQNLSVTQHFPFGIKSKRRSWCDFYGCKICASFICKKRGRHG